MGWGGFSVRPFVNPLSKVEVFRSRSEVQVTDSTSKLKQFLHGVISFNFVSNVFYSFFVFPTQVLDILIS